MAVGRGRPRSVPEIRCHRHPGLRVQSRGTYEAAGGIGVGTSVFRWLGTGIASRRRGWHGAGVGTAAGVPDPTDGCCRA